MFPSRWRRTRPGGTEAAFARYGDDRLGETCHVRVQPLRLGFFVLLGGLGYGAYLLHVPSTWIVVGALVVGLGVMSAVSHTKRRDPPADTPGV